MAALLYGTVLFSFSLIMQIIIWRLHLPKRQTKVLLSLFFSILTIGSFFLFKYSKYIDLLGIHPPHEVADYIQISIFFTALTLAYMITYSAVEADSPSLTIVLRIYQNRSKGIKKDRLVDEMNNQVLISPRIDDLLTDKMASLNNGVYTIEIKGKLMANIFILFRRIIKSGMGG